MIEPSPKPTGGQGSLVLFDAYNYAFRAYHALPMLNGPDGTPVNAVHGYSRMLQAVRREFMPEFVVAVFDAGGDGRRREVFPDYKAHRPPPPEDLRPQFPLIRKATDALCIPRVEDLGYEADDLIASYTRVAREQGLRVIIVSSDKDLMQLVDLGDDGSPPVLLWDTMKMRCIGPAEVFEKFGVPPAQLGDLLALVGDSIDNVPGVPGIGPKTAATLLAEYGSLEGVLENAEKIPQKARRENIVAHRENARLSRRLVALREDVPLPRTIPELRDQGADENAVMAFFEPLGFRQVIRELGGTRRREGAEGSAPSAAHRPDDPGAIEIGREAEFVPSAEVVAIGVDDLDRLQQLARAWAEAPRIGLAVLVDGDDPLTADLVGLAIAALGMPPAYLPIGHRQSDLVAGKPLPVAAIVECLRPVLARVPVVVHDHKIATHVLGRFGFPFETVQIDPMLASYALDPARTDHGLPALVHDVLGFDLAAIEPLLGKGKGKLRVGDLDVAAAAKFVGERAEATLALAPALQTVLDRAGPPIRKLLTDIEMPLAWVLRRIEPRGIAVDVAELRRQSDEITVDIARIQAKVDEQAGHPVHIDSPIQLQKLLFEERQLPPTRKTKTGYTTDAKALEELALLDPIVADILEYRSLVKLKGTYLDNLPALVRPDSGRLHTSFHQAVAATGRLSSSDPNLQNIPIRTVAGRRIREAFVAPPGRLLVALDYSQIELRILAHLSGDPNLASAFLEDVDVHRRTAAEVFSVSESAVTEEQRRIAKAVNFGVVYGQTAFGLAQQLGIPRGKAGSYIRAYFEKVPGVDRYMKELIDIAKARGFSETIFGRRRRIPELQMRANTSRSYGERIARNTPIQGSAADILKVAMIAVEQALGDAAAGPHGRPWGQMLLTVHDELIFECDEDRVDDLVALARPLMESAASLNVPLRVDAGHGRRWADCKG